MTSHRNYQCLRNLITGDEKRMLYIDYTYRCQWLSVGETGTATSKNDLHPKKAVLSVWWGVNGIIHWEILSRDCSMPADLYCQQLDRVAEKIKGKQDRMDNLHDKRRSHVAKSIREKLLKPRWITVPYPAYSPDLARMDYHLFHSLSNYLREKKLGNKNHVKIELITSLLTSPQISTTARSCICQSVGDEL